jgi:hypothetical protein
MATETKDTSSKIVNKLNLVVFGVLGIASMVCRHLYRFDTRDYPKYVQRNRLKKVIQENCPLNTLYRFQRRHLLISIQEMQVKVPLANVCRLLLGLAQPWYSRYLFGIKPIGSTDEDNWHIIGKLIKVGLAKDKEEETKDVYIAAFQHLLTVIDIDVFEPRHHEMIVWAACLLLELMPLIPVSAVIPTLTDRAKANLTNLRSNFVIGMVVLHRYENMRGIETVSEKKVNVSPIPKEIDTSSLKDLIDDDDIVWVSK